MSALGTREDRESHWSVEPEAGIPEAGRPPAAPRQHPPGLTETTEQDGEEGAKTTDATQDVASTHCAHPADAGGSHLSSYAGPRREGNRAFLGLWGDIQDTSEAT